MKRPEDMKMTQTTTTRINASSSVTVTKTTRRRTSVRAVRLLNGRYIGDVENLGSRRCGWVYYGRHDGNLRQSGFGTRREAVVALFKSDRRCRIEAALAGTP
jgi:hypothetical protein